MNKWTYRYNEDTGRNPSLFEHYLSLNGDVISVMASPLTALAADLTKNNITLAQWENGDWYAICYPESEKVGILREIEVLDKLIAETIKDWQVRGQKLQTRLDKLNEILKTSK